MPFKSEAQRKKFHQLTREGKMSQAMVDQWEQETGGRNLPARAGTPKKPSESQYSRALKRSKY